MCHFVIESLFLPKFWPNMIISVVVCIYRTVNRKFYFRSFLHHHLFSTECCSLEYNPWGFGLIFQMKLSFHPLRFPLIFPHSLLFQDLQRPPEGAAPVNPANSAFRHAAAGGALVPCQKVEERIQPGVAGRKRTGHFVADGDGLHDVTAAQLTSPHEQKERPSDVERQKAERKQQRDGDDGFDGFASPSNVVRVLRSGDGDRGSLPFSNSLCCPVTILSTLDGTGRWAQSLKDGPDHLRVAPSNDDKGHKEAKQVEDDSIRDVVCKFLIDGIVPAVHVSVLVLHLGVVPVLPGKPSLRHLTPAPPHISSLGKPEDGTGEDEDHHPHQRAGALHHPFALKGNGPHRVADPQVPANRRSGELDFFYKHLWRTGSFLSSKFIF